MTYFPNDAATMGLSSEVVRQLDDNQRAIEQRLADQRFVVIEGTSNGSGDAVLTHGVVMTQASILLAQAWYESGAGEATPAVVDLIDATGVTVSGAGASDKVRVTLVVGRKRKF